MERQEDILGLTLSELAFFIVLVLLLWPLIVKGGEPEPEPLEDPGEEITELKEKISRLEEDLRKVENPGPPGKPRCIDQGIAAGHLFKATIVDIDKYLVAEETLSLSQLRSRFASDMTIAIDAQCTHTVEINFAFLPGIHPNRYFRAEADLQRDFYVARRLTR